MKRALALAFVLLAGAPACGGANNGMDTLPVGSKSDLATVRKVRAALAAPSRPKDEKARDVDRHPVETLAFFGLRDDMHVVELWPGAGWYTAVLAPVLAEKGKLTVTSFDPNATNEGRARGARSLLERLAKNDATFGGVEVATIDPPENVYFGGEASADMVLTFRNFHGWIDQKIDAKVVGEAFRVLKPGGVFGVVEHRAKPGADPASAGKTGYVPEDYVIKVATGAGFKLDGKSEINANPSDTKDYPEGVWALPPTLDAKDPAKKDAMRAIGESDRMTLRFVKPAG